jgi:Uma2 family endonuclease
MSSHPKRPVSPSEYLALEKASETRLELDSGHVFALAGNNRKHNRLVNNLGTLLNQALYDRPCSVYTTDMKIRIPDTDKYTYPDVVVTCGDELYEEPETEEVLLNPLLLVEVLSTTTEAYDRGGKFERYQALPSLREYVLVSPWQPRVENFLRDETSFWRYTSVTGLDSSVTLASLSVTLSLGDLYRRVLGARPKSE